MNRKPGGHAAYHVNSLELFNDLLEDVEQVPIDVYNTDRLVAVVISIEAYRALRKMFEMCLDVPIMTFGDIPIATSEQFDVVGRAIRKRLSEGGT